jgi:3-oxoacyl-[acyl-carrier protein] reductase
VTGVNGVVVVVTGASRGIGRAVAVEAARRGAYVGLLARSEDDLARLQEALVAESPGGHGQHAYVVADVADREGVTKALARLEAVLGPTGILVNNAGIGAYSAVAETDANVFEEMVRVNYLGCVWPTLAVLPGMLRRGGGHIVNVASIAGRIGAPFEAAYSASKFAAVGFTESLAVEAAPFGVSVSHVDPGAVATEFFERRGHPYARSRPRPVPATRVAAAVLEVVERNRSAERIVPPVLRPAYLLKTLFPALARTGTQRAFSKELAALQSRLDKETS